jgi:outer membrane receptor protein involved in Fe transport
MYFDANIKHTFASGPFGGKLDLFFNVNNIFNKRPPAFPSKTNPTNLFPTYAPLYDIMGRYITVGAKIKF